MTNLKYSPLTHAVHDAVVAWLDTDPLLASRTAGSADARHLDAAYARLLPVLAAALWAARSHMRDDASALLGALADAERLVRPEDKADDRTHLLALKEIVRAHPDTNAARLLAYHKAVALLDLGEPGSIAAAGFDLVAHLEVLLTSHADLAARLAARDQTIDGLRDHLSRETKSSEAASAIADELSTALEKSREQVAALEGALRALRDAARTLLPEGSTPNPATARLSERVTELERLLTASRAAVDQRDALRRALETCREAIEGCNDIDDLLHMRDTIGLACNNAGLYRAVHPEDGPVYRWAADQGPPL